VLRLVTTAYWLVLILWIVLLFSAASVAMNAFGTLKGWTVALPDTTGLPADHASGRYLAGFVAEPAFRTLERATLVLAPAMAVLLFLQRRLVGWPESGWANRIREGTISLAITLAVAHLLFLAPGMAVDLAAYRAAVAAGEPEVAAARYAAFDARHVWADRLLRIEGFALLVGATISAWTLAPRRAPTRGARQTPSMVGMR